MIPSYRAYRGRDSGTIVARTAFAGRNMTAVADNQPVRRLGQVRSRVLGADGSGRQFAESLNQDHQLVLISIRHCLSHPCFTFLFLQKL